MIISALSVSAATIPATPSTVNYGGGSGSHLSNAGTFSPFFDTNGEGVNNLTQLRINWNITQTGPTATPWVYTYTISNQSTTALSSLGFTQVGLQVRNTLANINANGGAANFASFSGGVFSALGSAGSPATGGVNANYISIPVGFTITPTNTSATSVTISFLSSLAPVFFIFSSSCIW